MQGGGTGAFAAVAMNLINRTGSADYAVTGKVYQQMILYIYCNSLSFIRNLVR